MNKTSRTDEPLEGEGHNQSPNALSNDLVTNQDLNGIANAREQRARDPRSTRDTGQLEIEEERPDMFRENPATASAGKLAADGARVGVVVDSPSSSPSEGADSISGSVDDSNPKTRLEKIKHVFVTFGKFVGPGFLVSVAYIDPGNYATDIAAGASYRFRLLFVILVSNLIAIFLQNLAIKLGTVTGLNLAEACRAFLPRWLNYFLYFMAEAAIIATDIAEVIGTAIALNLLIPKLPLVAGCALSILDVMVILFFYRPEGTMRGLRLFEYFVMLLVLAVVACFCVQLSMIEDTTPGEVFKGYLPNNAVAESQGLLQSCGILGATVMPHSLYLGSGIVQSRLREYDAQHGLMPPERPGSTASSLDDGGDSGAKDGAKTYYVPSLAAIQHSLKYAYTETSLSLFTFALFVNSAILIVAGASLYGNGDALDADIFGIHRLLSNSLSPVAGTVFALALLFSGISAGIVCTIAGQQVCEGALRWRMKPWLRRLVTRSISITPSIIIAGASGRQKLNAALNGSQVALSVVLPFVSAPLIYFTCTDRIMRVRPGSARYVVEAVGVDGRDGGGTGSGSCWRRRRRLAAPGDEDAEADPRRRDFEPEDAQGQDNQDQRATPAAAPAVTVNMANKWYTKVLGLLIWLLIVVMNVANIVLLGLGSG